MYFDAYPGNRVIINDETCRKESNSMINKKLKNHVKGTTENIDKTQSNIKKISDKTVEFGKKSLKCEEMERHAM